jgi:hypothetical protein
MSVRYISSRKHELLKCVGNLLAKQERKFKGKRIVILGYDDQKRAIVAKSYDGEIVYIRSIAELRAIL